MRKTFGELMALAVAAVLAYGIVYGIGSFFGHPEPACGGVPACEHDGYSHTAR
jgi:hypothetical protein